MTHIENIPHILKYGITHSHSKNAHLSFHSIGDKSLINIRARKEVVIQNATKSRITLGDYTPFYFGVRMPMLYVVQNGGNFVERPTNKQDIIYIVCSIKQIIASNLTYYFCNAHATDRLTKFYDHNSISKIGDILDYNAIKTKYWSGEDNLDIKRKKQAEFLIKEDIPANFIVGWVCYNDIAKNKLIEMGISTDTIRVFPKAYF